MHSSELSFAFFPLPFPPPEPPPELEDQVGLARWEPLFKEQVPSDSEAMDAEAGAFLS